MSSSSGNTPGSGTGRTRLIAGAVGVLLIALLAVLLVRMNGDEPEGAAGPDATAEPTGDVSASPASPGASGSADPADPTEGSGGADGDPGEDDGTSGGSGGSDDTANTERPLRVTFSETAAPTPSLGVDVARVESLRSSAELPGETSRPSLRITVRVQNSTDESVAIGSALTNLYYGPDRTPANTSQRPGGRSFPGSVPAGGEATGVFVFNVPADQRAQVVLEVSVDAQVRRVEFSGDCSGSC